MMNGTERENQIACVAEVAMAKWKSLCCCLVLLSTQQQVEGDVGFEPYCGTCKACLSSYHYQIKATTHVNGHLAVKRTDPRDESQIYWLAIVSTETNTVKFVGYLFGPQIDKHQDRYCEIARSRINWQPGEDQNRWFWIPQNELTEVFQ